MTSERVRIGFAYDAPVETGAVEAGEIETVAAEYEDAPTLSWLRATLAELGEVVDLPWDGEIVRRIADLDLDVIFNITEGAGGRNRESLIPALAEARGIPYTGSDALGLGISLDKALTKVIAAHVGVPTPDFVKIASIDQWEALATRLAALTYPVIVKPNHGGSSLGIHRDARVDAPEALRERVAWLLGSFADEALVETFIAGREFTIGLLEAPAAHLRTAGLPPLDPAGGPVPRHDLRALPIAEVHLGDGNPETFFSYELKAIPDKDEVVCPATPPGESGVLMVDYATRVYEALGCRDMARVDFRLGSDGIPYFLEINPLPGLSPIYSTFPAQAEAAGMRPRALVHLLVRNALARGRDTP